MKLLSTIISKIRKRDLLLVLGILYISTLTIFGVLYWRVANVSSGEFFIFQNEYHPPSPVLQILICVISAICGCLPIPIPRHTKNSKSIILIPKSSLCPPSHFQSSLLGGSCLPSPGVWASFPKLLNLLQPQQIVLHQSQLFYLS